MSAGRRLNFYRGKDGVTARSSTAPTPNVVGQNGGRHGIWWVDDLGSWNRVDPKSDDNHKKRPFDGSPEHSKVAFAWLGLVKLQIRPTRVTVKWNVRKVSPESLGSALDFLATQPATRQVRLSFFFDGWNVENYASPAAAIARIRQTDRYREVVLFPGIHLRRQDLGAIGRAAPLIQDCFAAWDRTGGEVDPEQDERWARLMPHLLVCRPRAKDGRLIFASIGDQADCNKVYSKAWLKTATNRPYDFPHPGDFSDRTAEAYPAVLASGEPRFDHVRSLVPRISRDPIWAPYQRLLLPVRLADGSPAVVNAGKLTQDIDIPFLAG